MNFWRKDASKCGEYKPNGLEEGEDSAGLYGLHRKGETQAGQIRPWWSKLEKNEFDGMSPRKAYDQVAGDILAKNKDVDVRVLSGAILRKEYEH